MLTGLRTFLTRPAVRRRMLLLGIAGVLVWVTFLDGHSLVKRLGYAHERATLSAEVEQLRQENEALEARINAGLTDDVVEEVAREHFGMRRPGETVYPVEHLPD